MRVKTKNKSTTSRGIGKNSAYHKEFIEFTDRLKTKIIKLRQERKLTQEQMVAFDINLRQLQRIESGETRNITLSNLFKIAKALKLKVTELMDV